MDLSDAATLARNLMIKHGLGQWIFEFSRCKSSFGAVRHASKRITLSAPLSEINSVAEVTDTILHEIAHALVGRGVGHGPAWKLKAQLIGARPERCYNTADVKTPVRPWQGVCTTCNKKVLRYRRRTIFHIPCLSADKTTGKIVWQNNPAIKVPKI
jgi:predicted SprT family Zn-dependent metalloprotease